MDICCNESLQYAFCQLAVRACWGCAVSGRARGAGDRSFVYDPSSTGRHDRGSLRRDHDNERPDRPGARVFFDGTYVVAGLVPALSANQADGNFQRRPCVLRCEWRARRGMARGLSVLRRRILLDYPNTGAAQCGRPRRESHRQLLLRAGRCRRQFLNSDVRIWRSTNKELAQRLARSPRRTKPAPRWSYSYNRSGQQSDVCVQADTVATYQWQRHRRITMKRFDVVSMAALTSIRPLAISGMARRTLLSRPRISRRPRALVQYRREEGGRRAHEHQTPTVYLVGDHRSSARLGSFVMAVDGETGHLVQVSATRLRRQTDPSTCQAATGRPRIAVAVTVLPSTPCHHGRHCGKMLDGHRHSEFVHNSPWRRYS